MKSNLCWRCKSLNSLTTMPINCSSQRLCEYLAQNQVQLLTEHLPESFQGNLQSWQEPWQVTSIRSLTVSAAWPSSFPSGSASSPPVSVPGSPIWLSPKRTSTPLLSWRTTYSSHNRQTPEQSLLSGQRGRLLLHTLVWMSPSQGCHTLSQRSMPSAAVVGVVVAAIEEAGVAVIVGVEVPSPEASSRQPQTPTPTPTPTGGPSIQTCRQESGWGAPCTKNTGGGHTFVPNPPPVHGKIFLLQDLIETVTSLATLT